MGKLQLLVRHNLSLSSMSDCVSDVYRRSTLARLRAMRAVLLTLVTTDMTLMFCYPLRRGTVIFLDPC